VSGSTHVTGNSRAILLDTSVVIATFRLDVTILARLRTIAMVVSATVIGELYFGAHRSGRFTEQAAKIADLVTQSRVVLCDLDTGAEYGRIKHALELAGARIPENDLWIASSALQHGLPLATRDGHFNAVPGLVVEQW
jgi:tRNA(fMet)-specific endonuclease VapC